MNSQNGKEIIFVADPMCAWCYGFSEVIRDVRENYMGEAKISLVMGGLRVGPHHVRSEARKVICRQAWTKVNKSTGLPISFDILDEDGLSEDTEPASRASVVVRNLKPGRGIAYFKRIQESFFQTGADITRPGVLADHAEKEGIERALFLSKFHAPEFKMLTANDFGYAKALGATVFPTMLLKDKHGIKALTKGYKPIQGIRPYLNLWLQRP